MKANQRLSFILIAVLLTAIMACAGKSLKVDKISAGDDPDKKITQLENSINTAFNNDVQYLSPEWFKKAQRSLSTAKKMRKEGGKISEILKHIATGKAQIEKARENAKLARTAIPQAIKNRKAARNAGATSLNEEYPEAEEKFLELTRAIEDNNVKWARKNESEVANMFDGLELKAIKKNMLGKVRDLIREAQSKNAEKLAPRMFTLTRKKLAQTDKFITSNRYKKDEILAKAKESLFQAERLHRILDQSIKIRKQSSEQTALWLEDILYEISETIPAADMRNRNFKTQKENIQESIKGLKNDQQFLAKANIENENEIRSLRSDLTDLKAKLEGMTESQKEALAKLEAEKAFQKHFRQVRTYFNKDEAEIYKTESNDLLIRLRAIDFPVGKHILLPENYSLLSKVQQAIRTFGEPKAVIEGHTDSTGSEELNQDLSQKRANAVMQYLLANETLPKDNLMAVGFGSDKPIASNKTKEGRSLNRRIDVIINPQFAE